MPFTDAIASISVDLGSIIAANSPKSYTMCAKTHLRTRQMTHIHPDSSCRLLTHTHPDPTNAESLPIILADLGGSMCIPIASGKHNSRYWRSSPKLPVAIIAWATGVDHRLGYRWRLSPKLPGPIKHLYPACWLWYSSRTCLSSHNCDTVSLCGYRVSTVVFRAREPSGKP
jgi:hypothetical protein